MGIVKLTSKRQVTFPAEVCEGLGIEPGDEIELIPRIDENGQRVWLLQKKKSPAREWIGKLKNYAGNASAHSMDAVRESIKKGRRE